jgi:hypothetical protein
MTIGSEGQSFTDIGFRRPSWLDIGYASTTVIAVLLVFVFADLKEEDWNRVVGLSTG